MNKVILSLAFLFLSIPSAFSTAQHSDISDTIKVVRWYKVYWSGIHVADLKAEIKEDSIEASVDSFGIVKKISKYQSEFKSTFGYVEGKFIPYSYYTDFKQRKGSKKINLNYNKDGVIIEESVIPPDNRQKRPAVEDGLKIGSFDPLTVFMVARQKVKASLVGGKTSFNLNMYDGRRLADLQFKISPSFQMRINGKDENVIKVTFSRKPVKGFTNNELKRMAGEEPIFTTYVSNDVQLLPLKMDADAILGKAVLVFEKECPSIQECF